MAVPGTVAYSNIGSLAVLGTMDGTFAKVEGTAFEQNSPVTEYDRRDARRH